MWQADRLFHNAVPFTVTQGYNYCQVANPFLVTAGQTVELRQSIGIVAIDNGDVAPYCETIAANGMGLDVNLYKLDPNNNVRFYLRAYVSRTNPGPGKLKIFLHLIQIDNLLPSC